MKPIDDLTSKCIRCGFCLESCPTFVLSGSELESPRGRIYLVRSAEEGQIEWEDARPHIARCLGCRACETACPSGVEYGEIFELARDRLEQKEPNKTKKALLKGMTTPPLMKAQLLLGHLTPGTKIPRLLSRLLSGEKPEADKPKAQRLTALPPLLDADLPPVKGEVYLLEGCVMRVLFPRVHQVTRRLLRRVGYVVREAEQGCCGALHAHNGYLDHSRDLAAKLIAAMPDLPVVVDSAGCGSVMKEYGELFQGAGYGVRRSGDAVGQLTSTTSQSKPCVDEAQASKFARLVFDVSEFLLANGLVDALAQSCGVPETATYHDACHLSHAQKIRSQPRELLAAVPGLTVIPLNEAETCCGSAGIYNLTQPDLARQLLDRKFENIRATGAKLAVMGNPGCQSWVAQAARENGGGVSVLHTAELLEASFCGLQSFI